MPRIDDSDRAVFEPPAGLSEASVALWKQVVPKPISHGRAALLTQALECRERLQQVRETLAGESLTVTTERTKAVHVHPLVKVELELRRQFASIWCSLHLEWRPDPDGHS